MTDAADGSAGIALREQTEHLLRLATTSREPRRRQLQDEVVQLNLVVAQAVARRYRGRGEPLDDLEQVAALGLVKAVRRFEPDRGRGFLSFAIPTIRGEVKRHFRDYSWAVRPPRRIQELQPRLVAAHDELSANLGGCPTPIQLAAHLGETRARVVEAMTSAGCFHAASLDAHAKAPPGRATWTLSDVTGCVDDGYALTEMCADLAPALDDLPPRDQHILCRQVRDGWTQQQIADELDLSQMQISRVLKRIRARLRKAIGVAADPPPGGGR